MKELYTVETSRRRRPRIGKNGKRKKIVNGIAVMYRCIEDEPIRVSQQSQAWLGQLQCASNMQQ